MNRGQAGLQHGAHMRRIADNPERTAMDAGDAEACRANRRLSARHGSGRRTKLGGELGRIQPLMVLRRALSLLRPKQVFQLGCIAQGQIDFETDLL